MVLPITERDALLRAFDEFVATWLETPDGRAGLALYERSAREGKESYGEILAACRGGNPGAAAALLAEHVRTAGRSLARFLAEHERTTTTEPDEMDR